MSVSATPKLKANPNVVTGLNGHDPLHVELVVSGINHQEVKLHSNVSTSGADGYESWSLIPDHPTRIAVPRRTDSHLLCFWVEDTHPGRNPESHSARRANGTEVEVAMVLLETRRPVVRVGQSVEIVLKHVPPGGVLLWCDQENLPPIPVNPGTTHVNSGKLALNARGEDTIRAFWVSDPKQTERTPPPPSTLKVSVVRTVHQVLWGWVQSEGESNVSRRPAPDAHWLSDIQTDYEAWLKNRAAGLPLDPGYGTWLELVETRNGGQPLTFEQELRRQRACWLQIHELIRESSTQNGPWDGWAAKLLGAAWRDDVSSVVNDAFARLMQHGYRFDVQVGANQSQARALRTWYTSILNNAVEDLKRQKSRKKTESLGDRPDDVEQHEEHDPTSHVGEDAYPHVTSLWRQQQASSRAVPPARLIINAEEEIRDKLNFDRRDSDWIATFLIGKSVPASESWSVVLGAAQPVNMRPGSLSWVPLTQIKKEDDVEYAVLAFAQHLHTQRLLQESAAPAMLELARRLRDLMTVTLRLQITDGGFKLPTGFGPLLSAANSSFTLLEQRDRRLAGADSPAAGQLFQRFIRRFSSLAFLARSYYWIERLVENPSRWPGNPNELTQLHTSLMPLNPRIGLPHGGLKKLLNATVKQWRTMLAQGDDLELLEARILHSLLALAVSDGADQLRYGGHIANVIRHYLKSPHLDRNDKPVWAPALKEILSKERYRTAYLRNEIPDYVQALHEVLLDRFS